HHGRVRDRRSSHRVDVVVGRRLGTSVVALVLCVVCAREELAIGRVVGGGVFTAVTDEEECGQGAEKDEDANDDAGDGSNRERLFPFLLGRATAGGIFGVTTS